MKISRHAPSWARTFLSRIVKLHPELDKAQVAWLRQLKGDERSFAFGRCIGTVVAIAETDHQEHMAYTLLHELAHFKTGRRHQKDFYEYLWDLCEEAGINSQVARDMEQVYPSWWGDWPSAGTYQEI